MKRKMIWMLIGLAILFGIIFLYKFIVSIFISHAIKAQAAQLPTVSTEKVVTSNWEPQVKGVATTRAIKGVNVTTELAGMVTRIYFTPGSDIEKGTVMVQLNADTEIGQLHALQASLELAKITYERDKQQFAVHAVSKQQLDTDYQNVRNFEGQVQQQTATVAKKTIQAPFTGRLGVSAVNPGQYLNVGDTVATLQTLNPIYVDFYVPQQFLATIRVGQPVSASTNVFPGKTFEGKVTTINPIVDNTTRNVLVEGTVENPDYLLIPGLFAEATVITGKAQPFLTIPQAAISYNSYGAIVYVVTNKGKDDRGDILIANQKFVKPGDTRGEQVTVLSGLKEGDVIVTSGQIKLKNGDRILVNNAVQPSDSPNPVLKDK